MSENDASTTEFADHRIAMIGTGVMGEAVLSGIVRSGHQPDRIVVVDANPQRLAEVAEKYGVGSATATEAVAGADTVLLAVKPQHMGALLDEITPHLRSQTLVMSVAAGITAAYLEAALPEGTPVVRTMPNTPALIGEGMSAVSPGTHANPAHVREAEELMRASGKVIAVPESQLDAVTAISGSGPAYIFYVVEAMIEGGVLLGMPRPTATELVIQTLYGAAGMLTETGEHPTLLRERVSSPGGTTIAALRQLDENKVRAAFVTAMEAAARRSAELSSGQL